MGKVTGFIEIERHDRTYKPASDRIRNFNEFVIRSKSAISSGRQRAAWIAGFRSVTTAVR